VVFPSGVFLFLVLHRPVDKALGGQAGIGSPGIGADIAARLDLPLDNRNEISGFGIIYQVSKNLARSGQNAKDRLFFSAKASF